MAGIAEEASIRQGKQLIHVSYLSYLLISKDSKREEKRAPSFLKGRSGAQAGH